MTSVKDIVRSVLSLPEACVYIIIDNSKKTFSIGYTVNLRVKIGSIISDNLEALNDGAEFVILERVEDLPGLHYFCNYYTSIYINKGYVCTNRYKTYKQYVRCSVQLSISDNCVYLVLYNKRGERTPVGKFKNVEDAESFKLQYYGGSAGMGNINRVDAIGENRVVLAGQ